MKCEFDEKMTIQTNPLRFIGVEMNDDEITSMSHADFVSALTSGRVVLGIDTRRL